MRDSEQWMVAKSRPRSRQSTSLLVGDPPSIAGNEWMTFTLPNDVVPLSAVMAEFERRDPFPSETASGPSITCEDKSSGQGASEIECEAQDPREVYEERQVEAVVSALESCKGHLILVSDKEGERQVLPGVLRLIPPSWAHSGTFFCFHKKLRHLEAYDLTPVYLPKKFLSKVRAAFPVSSSGRPRHRAYEWYANMGFDRGDLTIKKLQRRMQDELGCDPPTPTTIRDWERKAKSKAESDREDE